MRMELWPETDEPQHRREMAMMLSSIVACHAIAKLRGGNPSLLGCDGGAVRFPGDSVRLFVEAQGPRISNG